MPVDEPLAVQDVVNDAGDGGILNLDVPFLAIPGSGEPPIAGGLPRAGAGDDFAFGGGRNDINWLTTAGAPDPGGFRRAQSAQSELGDGDAVILGDSGGFAQF